MSVPYGSPLSTGSSEKTRARTRGPASVLEVEDTLLSELCRDWMSITAKASVQKAKSSESAEDSAVADPVIGRKFEKC